MSEREERQTERMSERERERRDRDRERDSHKRTDPRLHKPSLTCPRRSYQGDSNVINT